MIEAPAQLPIDVAALDSPPIPTSEHAAESDDVQQKAATKGKKRTKDAAEKPKARDDWGFLIELLTKLDALGKRLDELGTRAEARHKELLKALEAVGARRSGKGESAQTQLAASAQAHEEMRAKLERVLTALETRNRLALLVPKVSRYWAWLRWVLIIVGCAGVGYTLVHLSQR